MKILIKYIHIYLAILITFPLKWIFQGYQAQITMNGFNSNPYVCTYIGCSNRFMQISIKLD